MTLIHSVPQRNQSKILKQTHIILIISGLNNLFGRRLGEINDHGPTNPGWVTTALNSNPLSEIF